MLKDTQNKVCELLNQHDREKVRAYLSYLTKLTNMKNKKGEIVNPWMQRLPASYLADIYCQVAKSGIPFDGKHVTLQKHGVSFDYIAYKNCMLRLYPETIIDMQIVHEGDDFNFQKESGKVNYTHTLSDPFNHNKKIVGVYCVIRNNRGEFLTILTKEEIDKHRQVAKTPKIWDSWPAEMTLKTVLKKACKNFQDEFKDIEELDNENYSLEKLDEQPSNQKPAYPNENIEKNIEAWKAAFRQDTSSPDNLIAMIQARYALSESQITRIKALKPEEVAA
jgi:hypothetical protein